MEILVFRDPWLPPPLPLNQDSITTVIIVTTTAPLLVLMLFQELMYRGMFLAPTDYLAS